MVFPDALQHENIPQGQVPTNIQIAHQHKRDKLAEMLESLPPARNEADLGDRIIGEHALVQNLLANNANLNQALLVNALGPTNQAIAQLTQTVAQLTQTVAQLTQTVTASDRRTEARRTNSQAHGLDPLVGLPSVVAPFNVPNVFPANVTAFWTLINRDSITLCQEYGLPVGNAGAAFKDERLGKIASYCDINTV